MPKWTKRRRATLRFCSVAALLVDLRRQGISLATDGTSIRLRGPRNVLTLETQTRVEVNAPELVVLLEGLDVLTRMGDPNTWWTHLMRTAGHGAPSAAAFAPDPEKTVLPDMMDDPPDTVPEEEPIAVDVETIGRGGSAPMPWDSDTQLVCVGFAVSGCRFAYPATAAAAIQGVLSTPNPKVFHNVAYDLTWLLADGFEVHGVVHDTLWPLALEGGVGTNGLKAAGPFTYPVHLPKDTPDLAKVLAYCGNDARNTIALYEEPSSWRAHPIYQLYQRMAPRVARVSLGGLPLFEERVSAMRAAHEAALAAVEARLQAIAPINWGSTNQVKRVLGESLPEETTNEDALRKTAHPAAPLLLERRRLDKVLSAYLRPWTDKTRIHGLIKLNAALTGRTSAQGGLQTIPRTLRTVFGHPDFDWVSLDFSAAELVVAAVITECPTLLAWFREGKDPHREAAARLFDVTPEAVTKAQRAAGKICNFNLLYGGGAGVLMAKAQEQGVKLSPERADVLVAGFFALFPEIRAWQDDVERRVRAGEAIESPLGRRWRIPPASWHLLNQALNAPIQSAASDLLLLGLDQVWDEIPGQVVNLVHDSAEILIPQGTFNAEVWRTIADRVARVDPRFPMRAAVAVGPSWGETEVRFAQGAEA